jgi:hypothetical protein
VFRDKVIPSALDRGGLESALGDLLGLVTLAPGGNGAARRRNRSGGFSRLQLLHPDDEPTEKAIRELVDIYKRQFKQGAVLRTISHTCASF